MPPKRNKGKGRANVPEKRQKRSGHRKKGVVMPDMSVATPGEGGGSGDAGEYDACPYGLVGKAVSVPGKWWGKGLAKEKHEDIFVGTIDGYYHKFKFKKALHQCWVIDIQGDPEMYPCSYYDVCHFVDKAERPCDYVASDDEDGERGEIGEDDDNAYLSEDEAPKERKVQQPWGEGPRALNTTHFSYAVPSDKLPAEEREIRRSIERLHGIWKEKWADESEKDGTKMQKTGYVTGHEPKGWSTTPNGADPPYDCVSSGEMQLTRVYTRQQAEEWTEYDSWELCHPKAARDVAVEWTQDYYESSIKVGKKPPYEGKTNWPEDKEDGSGGFQEEHYIGA